jgi:hypothetical protein
LLGRLPPQVFIPLGISGCVADAMVAGGHLNLENDRSPASTECLQLRILWNRGVSDSKVG